jgi:hypothetical protein
MYLRKCDTRRASAADMYAMGVLPCDDAEEGGGMLSDMCWRVSGRPTCLIWCASGDGSDVLGDRSSNRSRTTTFGSDLVLLLESDPLLTICRELVGLLSPEPMAYSGSSAKLRGVTTTLYVPGRFVSAFRSRSSSFVSVAKAGRFRPESEVLNGLSVLTVAATRSAQVSPY